MSAKKEVLERERERERPVQPREIQPSRPQDIKTSREKEDTDLYNRYAHRHNEYNDKLADLIARRSYMENEFHAVESAIKYHQQEQARVAQEYKDKQEAIQAQRRLEDQRAAHDQMELERRESGKMNGQGRTRRASIREITHQENGSGGWTSINARPRSRREDDEEHHADPGNLLGKGYQPMDDAEPNGRSTQRTGLPRHGPNGHDVDADDSEASLAYRPRKADEQRPLKPKQRHSLPSFAAGNRGSPKQETPIESKPRSPSGRRSLPSGRSQATSAEAAVPPDMTEINKDTLILKHDGQVYVEPPMYEGVPLERIDKNHPYWDSDEWEPLEDVIGPQLEKWQEKLDTLRRTPDAVRHTVFLANRQVNRGQAVVDFLKDGDFHPYQYVGKEMMKKFYKTFINYDTMFRLVNVHEELKKFDLDVTPLEWLRQRMFEVSRDQGDKFSLSKYTHDLYHDYKLKALREKHGFGNIGRPSGYKVGEKNPDKVKNGKIKRESSVGDMRRKGRRISQVDMGGDPSMIEHYHTMHQHPQQRQEYLDPLTPRQSKRLRLEADAMAASAGGMHPRAQAQALAQAQQAQQAQAFAIAQAQHAQQVQAHGAAPMPVKAEPEPEVDDLEFDGYTSTDSFSAGRIMHLDFRIYQIKTSELTTSTEITQYWTWSQEKSMFEHQVLRDVHPKVTWGYYQQHITFDLKLDDVVEVFYAKDCLKVIVETKTDRRNILVHFKRDRTLKRFLSFSRRKGVQLVKSSSDRIEDAWNKMESKVMADDSDS
ncbi:hypothetical protein PG984_013710 [Apiospora sp. TS-2023a]